MSFSPLRRTPAVLAALIFFTDPTIYLLLENYASRAYTPYYSYIQHFTSSLGVPYPYDDPVTGVRAVSERANIMNINFVVKGLLYLAGHRYLIQATAHRMASTTLTSARMVIAILYCIGIILVAAIPAGPIAEDNGTMILHVAGAVMAIGGGSVNCLLAVMSSPVDLNPTYQIISLLLGIGGLSGLPITSTFKDTAMLGFWQRTAIYPTLCWEYATAVTLALELLQPDVDIKKE